MGRVEKSIEIRASPEKVWEMFAFDRFPEWQVGYSGVKSVDYTSEVRTPEDKFRVGASAQGIPRKEGKSIEFYFEVTESLENEKIAHRMYGKYRAFVTFILEPVGEGTRFTYVVDYEMPWGILGKIIEPLFGRRIMEREVGKDLKNLKSVLEK